MDNNLTQADRDFLNLAIESARQAFAAGNYPVGAVLVIDHELADRGENKINERKSYLQHAEITMIIRNAEILYEAAKQGKEITIYSTLEPCIQCLGASVTNNVNRIVYIQNDPNGGACNISHDQIGLHYKTHWPHIIHAAISEEPLKMMLEFFRNEISKGHTGWPELMLKLLGRDGQPPHSRW